MTSSWVPPQFNNTTYSHCYQIIYAHYHADDETQQLRSSNTRTAVVNQISALGHIPDQVNYNEFDLPSSQVVDTTHISDDFETEEEDDDIPDEDITTILEEPHSGIPTDTCGSVEL